MIKNGTQPTQTPSTQVQCDKNRFEPVKVEFIATMPVGTKHRPAPPSHGSTLAADGIAASVSPTISSSTCDGRAGGASAHSVALRSCRVAGWLRHKRCSHRPVTALTVLGISSGSCNDTGQCQGWSRQPELQLRQAEQSNFSRQLWLFAKPALRG
jgi:hypothetical protein